MALSGRNMECVVNKMYGEFVVVLTVFSVSWNPELNLATNGDAACVEVGYIDSGTSLMVVEVGDAS